MGIWLEGLGTSWRCVGRELIRDQWPGARRCMGELWALALALGTAFWVLGFGQVSNSSSVVWIIACTVWRSWTSACIGCWGSFRRCKHFACAAFACVDHASARTACLRRKRRACTRDNHARRGSTDSAAKNAAGLERLTRATRVCLCRAQAACCSGAWICCMASPAPVRPICLGSSRKQAPGQRIARRMHGERGHRAGEQRSSDRDGD